MSNELPWQVWTPDDLAPPPETFVPVEADNVTLTDDTPEPELTAEQQLEQELAQLKIQAHEQGYNAGLAEGRQKGHAQGYQEGLAQGLARTSPGADAAGADSCPYAAVSERVSEHT